MEVTVGKLDPELQEALSRKLQRRSTQQQLMDRMILRENRQTNEFQRNRQQLGDLLAARRGRGSVEHLKAIHEDENSQESKKTSVVQTEAQQHRRVPSSKFVLDVPKVTKEDFEAKQMVIGKYLTKRPTPEALVEQRVIQDIGHLPKKADRSRAGALVDPTRLEALSDVKATMVAVGWGHSFVIDEHGQCHAFGNAQSGRLGVPEIEEPFVFKPHVVPLLKALGRVTQIGCGDNHCAAVVGTQLYTWGEGQWGRLGHNDIKDVSSPLPVEDLKAIKVQSVACGGYHTLIASKPSGVLVFGWNKSGRLGVGKGKEFGTMVRQPVALPVFADIDVKQVVAGQGFSAAVTADGVLYTWGTGAFGATGHGNEKDVFVPTIVSEVKDIERVACGGTHMLALCGDGSLYSWGHNKFGQLGRESADSKQQFDAKAGLVSGIPGKITFIAAGKSHSLAIADGVVYTWGYGSRGALGHGDESNQSSPKAVSIQEKAVYAACGWVHTLVVTESGAVYGFGGKEFGKLAVE